MPSYAKSRLAKTWRDTSTSTSTAALPSPTSTSSRHATTCHLSSRPYQGMPLIASFITPYSRHSTSCHFLRPSCMPPIAIFMTPPPSHATTCHLTPRPHPGALRCHVSSHPSKGIPQPDIFHHNLQSFITPHLDIPSSGPTYPWSIPTPLPHHPSSS